MDWNDVKSIIGKAAPVIGTLIGGPAGGAVGGLVASVLGTDNTPDAIVQELKANPDALLKIKQLESDERVELRRLVLQAETQRLTEVNKTMRAEVTSDDAYTRRWRPSFGYAMVVTWVLQTVAIAGVMIYATVAADAELAPKLFTGIKDIAAALTIQWSVALGVLGINVTSRSKDKRVRAGQPAPGILETLAAAIKK